MSITGVSAQDFRVVMQSAATVAANGGATAFSMAFNPNRPRVRQVRGTGQAGLCVSPFSRSSRKDLEESLRRSVDGYER